MTQWARIQAGKVVELISPPAGATIAESYHAGLEVVDCTASAGVAVGWTFASGIFTSPPAPPPPSLADQARALLGTGVHITSSVTPAVNALYPVDPDTRATLAEVVSGIAAGHGFPGGGNAFDLTLSPTVIVTFPSTAVFLVVAQAIRDWIYACVQVANGRSSTLPAASVAID